MWSVVDMPSKPIASGNFTFTPLEIEDVVLVETRTFDDGRGFFMETYRADDFAAGGIDCTFVQDNQSQSTRGVLRGMHFQIEHPQAKLVRVISGEIFDVAVDIRPESPTYGAWVGAVLSDENRRQLFVPHGFAHGFLVMSPSATVCYKCDDIYHPGDEGGIAWDDPDVAIDWPLEKAGLAKDALILSEKDRRRSSLRELDASRA